MKKTVAVVVSVVVFFLIGANQLYARDFVKAEEADSFRGSVAVGQNAPNFTVPLVGGSTFTLEDYEGYIVLINLWGWG